MQTVCFETAKLAKEKGFNYMYSTNQFYYIIRNGSLLIGLCGKIGDVIPFFISDEFNIVAPYQHDLLDWLRELHNLHIEILYDYENDNTSYHYTIRTIGKENGRDWKEDYATYEECLETALQEALKMI